MSDNVISKIKLPDGTSYDLKDNGAVRDVQVDGTSIIDAGIANIPIASRNVLGLVKVNDGGGNSGITIDNGTIKTISASSSQIKSGVGQWIQLTPGKQHQVVFYGLSKVAGEDLANETVTVGTYPEASKTAIRSMIGAVGNADYASTTTPGIVQVGARLAVESNKLLVRLASADQVKAGTTNDTVLTPGRSSYTAFYGLAKAAGDTTQSTSENAVGTYTDNAKTAIRAMLGVAASNDMNTKVDKTAIDNAGIINKTYTTKFNGQFSVTTAANQNYISPYVRASVTGRINKHKNHRVTINGQQYILPTRLWYLREGEGIKVYQYLGNLNLYVSDTTGVPDGTDDVPFIIISDINDSSSIDVLTETAGTYTILVEQINNTQTALPKSLIWDDSYVPILKNNNGGTYNGFSIGVNELNSTRGTCAIGYGNIINNQFSYSIGINNTINGINGIAIGNLNTVAGSFAFGSHLLADKTNMTAVGYQNAAAKSYTTWATNTQYNVGDVVYATINGLSLYLICTTAHTSTNVLSDAANWKPIPSNGDTAFVVGNGNPINTSNRSNALKLDWLGNLYLGGNVYVGAGADSTGGTKLAALSDIQIDGTSIISNGITTIPKATNSKFGVVKISDGLTFGDAGVIRTNKASASDIKAASSNFKPIVPALQHAATFYGLATAAGDTTQSQSDNAVGTYTDSAKTAIRTMLGAAASNDMSTKVDKTAIDNAGITSYTYTTLFGGQFSATTASNQDYISPYVRASVTGRISKHYLHKVTFNGNEYILPTRLWYAGNIKVYEYLGNLALYVSDISGVPGGTDNVPFLIISDLNDSSSIDVLTETAGTYTIKVERMTPTQKPLPKSLIYGDNYTPIELNNNGGTYNGFSIGVNELKNTRGTFAIGYGNLVNNQFSFAFGMSNTVSNNSIAFGISNTVSNNGIAIGETNNVSATGIAIGNDLTVNGANMIALGRFNVPANTSFPQFAANTVYHKGDIVVGKWLNVAPDMIWMCVQDHTSANNAYLSNDTIDGVAAWRLSPSTGDTLLAVGNSSISTSRSNALKVDLIGNMFLGGNVFVNSDANSTGGTKLATVNDITVHDVQINGTSILSNGTANIPIASSSTLGMVKTNTNYGIVINPSTGQISTRTAGSSAIKEGTDIFRPIAPGYQHYSTFYGLSKAAGVDMSSSSNEVGTYTAAAKTAIQNMIGVENGVTYVENISDTDVSISGVANTRYICGTVSTISITPPSAGIIDVIFTSGTSPAVLTLPNTVKLPAWFDKTTLDTETTYEINIADGVLGAVMTWA